MDYIFKGIEGKQWGKTVYTTNIPFIELREICRVDPEVQRKADKKKMTEISKYILEGMDGTREMTGFSAIVTSLRYSSLSYDSEKCEIKISTRGKLYITDGQHREGGIEECYEYIISQLEYARNDNDNTGMEYWEGILSKLEEMSIPVVIFTNLTKDEEQQLFHDLNNLGTQVNPSQALKFDQNDKFNKISKYLENKLPIVNKFGINKTVKSLSDKSPEIATLKIWNNCNRILLNGPSDKEMKQEWNPTWDFNSKKDLCLNFWNALFNILPEDFNNKNNYIITKSVYLQGLAAFGHKLINEFNKNEYYNIIQSLKSFDWSYTNDIYSKFNGGSISTSKLKSGEIITRFKFKGTRAAINSVSAALEEYSLKKYKK